MHVYSFLPAGGKAGDWKIMNWIYFCLFIVPGFHHSIYVHSVDFLGHWYQSNGYVD